MSAKKRLQEIQQKLIPWHRHFYTLRGDQKPAPLPDGVLEELRAFVADFPESEKGLRELAGLEAGMGNTAGSIAALACRLGETSERWTARGLAAPQPGGSIAHLC